jgi:hypothetical protein
MKKLLLCGAAAIVLASCGGKKDAASSADVDSALMQLSLKESGSGRVEFKDRKITGGDAVFKNVKIRTSDFAEAEVDVDGAVDLDGLEIDASMDSADLAVSEMTFSGLSLTEAGKANFSGMKLKGIKAVPTSEEDDDVSVTTGEVELMKPSPALAAWVAGIFGQGESSDLPEVSEMTFDNFAISDFKASGKDIDGEGKFGIKSIKIADVHDLKAGEMSMNDMDISFTDAKSGNKGLFKLGGIKLKGANLELLKSLDAESEEAAAEAFSNALYSNPIDPGFDAFELTGLDFNMEGLTLALPKMVYDITRNKDGIPTSFDMPKFTMTMDVDDEGGEIGAQVAPLLMALGFETLELSAEARSSYDPRSDISTSDVSRVSLKNGFVLDSTGKIGGISKLADVMQTMDTESFANGSQDPTTMMLDMYSVLDFHNFSLSLKDDGIVDKAFAFFAAQQGADPAQLRQQVGGMVAAAPMMAQGFGVDPKIAMELSTAVSSFLTNSGTLTITLNPETPFTLTALMTDPGKITKESLGLTAKNVK